MVLVVIAFAMFCAFIAYAPEGLAKALLAGVWVLMALGTVGTVGCAIIEQVVR